MIRRDRQAALEVRKFAPAPRVPKEQGLVGLMAHAVFRSRRTVDDMTLNHPYRDWLDELALSIDVMLRLPAPRSNPRIVTNGRLPDAFSPGAFGCRAHARVVSSYPRFSS